MYYYHFFTFLLLIAIHKPIIIHAHHKTLLNVDENELRTIKNRYYRKCRPTIRSAPFPAKVLDIGHRNKGPIPDIH